MSKIYFKVTIETFLKLWFSGFKKFVTMSVWESSNSRRCHWILKLFLATYKSDVWKKNCVWLFYYFNFERSYDVLKLKSPYILLSKSINVYKNKTESKVENPTHSFRETNLVLQLILKSEIKSQTAIMFLTFKF